MVRHRLVSGPLVRASWLVRYILLVLPPAGMTVALAIVIAAELSGFHPLTEGAPRSVPEALALRDEATAARMLEDGSSAEAIGLIRAGVFGEQPVLATPLEAAVLVDAVVSFEFLVSRGAPVTPNLGCLADDVGARAVRQRVRDSPSCPRGSALAEILDRP
jgi:hypothetical protein